MWTEGRDPPWVVPGAPQHLSHDRPWGGGHGAFTQTWEAIGHDRLDTARAAQLGVPVPVTGADTRGRFHPADVWLGGMAGSPRGQGGDPRVIHG